MKKAFLFFVLALAALIWTACSKDDPKPKEKEINHVGDKWTINSVSYTLVDQNLSNPGQAVKTGTLANAGAFYFDGTTGSFDIEIEDVQKEDVFSVEDDAGDITIISINQSVGVSSFSQHVIAISGEQTSATTMTLQGTVTKQSLTSQFVLTATFELLKE